MRTRTYVGIAAFGIAAIAGACAPSPGALAPSSATEADIEAEDVRIRIGVLASDSMAGRETGMPGAAAAARYLSSELERLGLQPAGDNGTYLASVPLQRKKTDATVTVTSDSGTRTLDSSEILPVSGLGGLPEASRDAGSGPLVFGGHLADPAVATNELGMDQLSGAVVIVRLGLPEGVDAATAAPRPVIASLFSPISPASAVILVAEGTEAEFWDYAADIASKGAVSLADGASTASGTPTGPPFFLATPEAVEEMIGGNLAEAREPRTNLGTLEFTLEQSVDEIEGWNVAGIVQGSDPARADEHVGLGAHYDHVGIGSPVADDSIYNGADDNASGTTALLEVAEALANLPQAEKPARSVLFVWNTAEESGLLGSEHFTDEPTVDRESIIAHVNLDMVGRNDPDSLFIVGSRRLSTDLGDIVEAVNQSQEDPFIFDYTFDEPGHPEQIYCRSDHYSYARYGIPIVFFTSGLHDQYHAPADEIELIDFEKVARVSELVFDLTMELANRAEPPEVDQTVPPLGTPCT